MTSDHDRDVAIRHASDEVMSVYGGLHTGELLAGVYNKYLFPSTDYRTYVTLIGDVILGLEKRADLPQLLHQSLQIEPEICLQLVADLNSLLSTPTHTELNHDDEAASQLSKTEIPTVRTMQSDSNTNAQVELPDWSSQIRDADSLLAETEAGPEERVVQSTGQDELLKRMKIDY